MLHREVEWGVATTRAAVVTTATIPTANVRVLKRTKKKDQQSTGGGASPAPYAASSFDDAATTKRTSPAVLCECVSTYVCVCMYVLGRGNS